MSNNKLIYKKLASVSLQRYNFETNLANIDGKGFMHIFSS